MRVVIYPYKFGSASAKALASALNTVRVRDVGRYVKKAGDIVIGWGSTMLPTWGTVDLNKPESVARAVDKKVALSALKEAGVRTVEFTEDSDIVQQWLSNGNKVYARTLTRASEGRGIHVLTRGMQIPSASLYTLGINDGDEYRVHVFDGVVIDYTKKVPLDGSNPSVDARNIKSHSNGWTFARNAERRPSIEEEAVKAVRALGLDFGAVDIIVNPNDKNRPYVLEVNTACGMEDGGRTIQSYIDAINRYINKKNVTKQNVSGGSRRRVRR